MTNFIDLEYAPINIIIENFDSVNILYFVDPYRFLTIIIALNKRDYKKFKEQQTPKKYK